ncbi:hypothetical protein UFOVP136_28 [uncultured Caudovirales phage]|uniref:Phage head morphogenesis domain-containing protein n=1 Tax=uncultured Caudovirales phage TaxID=2100421 RepID=A0A6J5LG46_9CAUD|nr:hypothetical protein UFOVP136_28 [uncultured Caudovirales phage]
MTINEFIRSALDRVMEHGWTPELIALIASEYRQLIGSNAFNKSPQQSIEPYLNNIFKREIDSGNLLKRNPDIDRFTLERIKPQFRSMLEDRIKANIQLIKLERANSIDVSTARLSGWLMSFNGVQEKLPPAKELPAFQSITRPMREQKSYEHSRRAIDQGHKLIRAIDATIAEQGGAIAAVWHSHKKTAYYDARPEHTAREGEIYIYKNSPAIKNGLVKKGDNPYFEDLPDPPALLINCTCWAKSVYSLNGLYRIAPDRLTKKGLELIGK